MRLALYAVAAACSLQTASALAARRPPPPDLTKIYKDTVAAGNEPGSAAARPINKRKVVVCGAGGEAGRFVFGYVQRAAQTFESGLKAPRALVGAARGSRALNVCLATSFILAYADESLVSRCDFRDDEIVKKRLDGCSMVVAPYRMRPQGAVTGTEWTWDLDQAGGESEPFSRICANVQDAAHVIAVAAPADAAAAQSDLEASGVPHTLLVTKDLATTKRWNLNEGIQQVVGAKRGADAAGEVQVEDLGALIAQAVSILDPTKSRVLSIGALADGASTPQESLAKAINTALLSPA